MISCGTRSGYQQHLDDNEPACSPCTTANRVWEHTRRRVTRAGGGEPPVTELPAGDPDLDGAACHPWTGIHDSRKPREPDNDWIDRLGKARRICRTCPVLAACRKKSRQHIEAGRRLDGIWAGRHYRTGGTE